MVAWLLWQVALLGLLVRMVAVAGSNVTGSAASSVADGCLVAVVGSAARDNI